MEAPRAVKHEQLHEAEIEALKSSDYDAIFGPPPGGAMAASMPSSQRRLGFLVKKGTLFCLQRKSTRSVTRAHLRAEAVERFPTPVVRARDQGVQRGSKSDAKDLSRPEP